MITRSTNFLNGLSQSMSQWTQCRFLDAIHESAVRPTEPSEVLELVKCSLLTPNDKVKALALGARLDEFREDALALAAHNLQRQAKSLEQRRKEKK